MNRSFFTENSQNNHKIFLQNGFWADIAPSFVLHKHNYTEFHVIHGGSCRFTVDDKELYLQGGELLVIPPKKLHCCTESEDTTRHRAFQMDCDIDYPVICNLSDSLAKEFFAQIENKSVDRDYSVIASFTELFYSLAKRDNLLLPEPISDDAFLIREFFSCRYFEDVKLSELAFLLHRSERQTERLVISYTGHTFSEELARTRIEIAKHLIETSSVSLREISERVGYRSYAGFWKAMKRYG